MKAIIESKWVMLALAGVLASAVAGTAVVATAGSPEAEAPAAAIAPHPLDVRELEGDWYIAASDQPVWTSGEKASPKLHYKVLGEKAGKLELEDQVSFIEGGKPGAYRGRDTQSEDDPNAFEWRGSGALSLISTRWRLVHMSSDKRWAVAFYEKTIATPAGVAILSRSPSLSADAMTEVRSFLSANDALRAHGAALREVVQADASAAP
jgi:hypothetical protein